MDPQNPRNKSKKMGKVGRDQGGKSGLPYSGSTNGSTVVQWEYEGVQGLRGSTVGVRESRGTPGEYGSTLFPPWS
jgi:hypothetical protein